MLPEREAMMLRWLAKRADRTPQEYLEWVIRTMHESAGVFSDESMNDGGKGLNDVHDK